MTTGSVGLGLQGGAFVKTSYLWAGVRVGATEDLLENHGLPWRRFRSRDRSSHRRRVIGFDRRRGFDRPALPGTGLPGSLTC